MYYENDEAVNVTEKNENETIGSREHDAPVSERLFKDVEETDGAKREYYEETDKSSSKVKIAIIATVIGLLLIGIFSFAFLGDNDSSDDIMESKVLDDNVLRELLQGEGFTSSEISSATIADRFELNGVAEGISGSELVLIKIGDKFSYAVINMDSRSLRKPLISHDMLRVVQDEIFKMDKFANVRCSTVFKGYIEKYGVDCMTEREHAENYLRDITSEQGVISTKKAQQVINNAAPTVFPETEGEVVVLFEKESAVPKYYAVESRSMVYRWGSFLPESHYDFLDANSQRSLSMMYGPAYGLGLSWKVYDMNKREVGLYDSLEQANNYLIR